MLCHTKLRLCSRRFMALAVLVSGLSFVPGGAYVQATGPRILKVAVPFPRMPDMAMELQRYNQQLAIETNNALQVRVYWGGVAGDDIDALRKMKIGQIDCAPLSVELVSSFTPGAMILATPGLFTNYRQIDAIRRLMTPQLEAIAYEHGFKVMAWADIGRLRILSNRPIYKLSDLKQTRPWLYPHSEALKTFYTAAGVAGVPLGLVEVYTGLQTGLINMVWGSVLLAVALQWHSSMQYVTRGALGVVSGALVIRRPVWDELPDEAQKSLSVLATNLKEKNQKELRRMDRLAFFKLIQSGYKAILIRDMQRWRQTGRQVREQLVGRLYSREQLALAEEIAARHPDLKHIPKPEASSGPAPHASQSAHTPLNAAPNKELPAQEAATSEDNEEVDPLSNGSEAN